MNDDWIQDNQSVFVDTNVLFYAVDRDSAAKHERAVDLIDRLFESGRGVLSIQVLQELSVNLWKQLSVEHPRRVINSILDPLFTWDVISPGRGDVLEANRIVDEYGFSFWDSMIVQTARTGGCRWLLSEDLQHGQSVGESLTVEDPFQDL